MWGAAADTGAVDAALVTAIWAFLGIVVTTLGVLIAPIVKARFDRASSTTTPPTPVNGNGNGTALITLAKDIGQLDERANDSDERDDWQDKRLDRLERWAEDHDPEWRG